jgi:hypothetical protein
MENSPKEIIRIHVNELKAKLESQKQKLYKKLNTSHIMGEIHTLSKMIDKYESDYNEWIKKDSIVLLTDDMKKEVKKAALSIYKEIEKIK